MNVVLVGGNRGLGETLKTKIDLGPDAYLTQLSRPRLDLTSPEAVIENTVRHYAPRKIDALVISSGLAIETGVFAREADFRSMLQVNFLGPLAVYRACLRGLLRARGKVILVSSTVTRRPSAQWLAHYAASKGALEGWAIAESRRLAKHGVAMCVVRPGWFANGMADNLDFKTADRARRSIPMGRFGWREEVAYFIHSLLFQSNWCLAGQTYEVTGGA